MGRPMIIIRADITVMHLIMALATIIGLIVITVIGLVIIMAAGTVFRAGAAAITGAAVIQAVGTAVEVKEADKAVGAAGDKTAYFSGGNRLACLNCRTLSY